MNIIIMFGHRARVGKDTSASFLQELGYKRVAFADKLKNTVADLYTFSHDQMYGEEKDILDERYDTTPRQILQKFGQDQRAIYKDIWASYVFNQIENFIGLSSSPNNYFCITDFRFRNEYDVAMKWLSRFQHIIGSKESGVMIENPTIIIPVKIIRDIEIHSGSNDISEHDLDEFEWWNHTVDNNSTLENLKYKIISIHNTHERSNKANR